MTDEIFDKTWICPHCGAIVELKKESKHYSARHGKKVQFARLLCQNNNRFNLIRCYYKSTAGEVNEIVKFADELNKLFGE